MKLRKLKKEELYSYIIAFIACAVFIVYELRAHYSFYAIALTLIIPVSIINTLIEKKKNTNRIVLACLIILVVLLSYLRGW